jgi:hypothetical protein
LDLLVNQRVAKKEEREEKKKERRIENQRI